jgi:hypothetical protein
MKLVLAVVVPIWALVALTILVSVWVVLVWISTGGFRPRYKSRLLLRRHRRR